MSESDDLHREASLRHAITQYLTHYHRERNHQGLDNRLLKPIRIVSERRLLCAGVVDEEPNTTLRLDAEDRLLGFRVGGRFKRNDCVTPIANPHEQLSGPGRPSARLAQIWHRSDFSSVGGARSNAK